MDVIYSELTFVFFFSLQPLVEFLLLLHTLVLCSPCDIVSLLYYWFTLLSVSRQLEMKLHARKYFQNAEVVLFARIIWRRTTKNGGSTSNVINVCL